MSDEIRALSAALARDPASLVYVELAEALRRRGQLNDAAQVVMQGLARHPMHADGFDALARVHADRGDLAQARSAWERALAIAPEHVGSLKGIGFVSWRLGELNRAEEALEHALLLVPDDESVARALESVRSRQPMTTRITAPIEQPVGVGAVATPTEAPAPAAAGIPSRTEASAVPAATPASPVPRAPALEAPDRPPVFTGFEGSSQDILLLDARGLVLAGGLRGPDGADVSELAAAALAGVSGEASRTAEYLHLGSWSAMVAETGTANLVLAPSTEGALLMIRRERSTPVGLALRIAERARAVAQHWLEGQGA
jgi:tetratricopeptide (TPR) repeat protein